VDDGFHHFEAMSFSIALSSMASASILQLGVAVTDVCRKVRISQRPVLAGRRSTKACCRPRCGAGSSLDAERFFRVVLTGHYRHDNRHNRHCFG
jgi:hypothetical protein